MPANQQKIVHLILSPNKAQNSRLSSLGLVKDLSLIVSKIERLMSDNILLIDVPWTKADPLLFLLMHENGLKQVVEVRKALIQDRSRKETKEIVSKLKVAIAELKALHSQGFRIEAITAMKWGCAIFVLADKKVKIR